MKKKLIVICLVLMIYLVCCTNVKKEKIKVLLPGATPFVSIGGLLNNERFDFNIVNGQDPLSAAFVDGGYDIIIAPLNLASKLYINESTEYKFEAIITSDNAYLVSREEFALNDINKKSIVSFGTGSAPWLVLKAVIDKYSLEVDLINKNSVSDVAEVIISQSENSSYYLIDEPTATILKLNKGIDLHILDLSTFLDSQIIFAALFVNPTSKVTSNDLKLIEDNIKDLNEYPVQYANKILNLHTYFTGLGVDVISNSIPKCKITYLKAKTNKDIVNSYFNLLNKYNPNVLGGKTPNEEFYY